MLLLKKHLVELVKAGKKRQTIRFWQRPMVRAGAACYCHGLGRIFITAVEEIRLKDLTRADAVADGFASLRELHAELQAIYGPDVPNGKRCYRVTFEWPVGKKIVTREALRQFVVKSDPHQKLQGKMVSKRAKV